VVTFQRFRIYQHPVNGENKIAELNMSEIEKVSGAWSFSIFGGTAFIFEKGYIIGWEKAL
jgi:hypothetical protein